MVSENCARNCLSQTHYDGSGSSPLESERFKGNCVSGYSGFNVNEDDEIESTNEVNATKIKTVAGTRITENFALDRTEDEIPDQLRRLLSAVHEKLPDTAELPPLPRWADVEKVKKGQQFGLKYLYGLNYSQTLSLLYLFSAPDGLTPLIFTEKSHTPFLAHKRYLSTTLKVKSWYETAFWEPSTAGYKNLMAVKSSHLHVSKRLSELSANEIEQRSNLEKKLRDHERERDAGMLCPLQRILKRDFKDKVDDGEGGGVHAILSKTYASSAQRRVYFNQMEMSTTQFGFFGLMLTYPEKFAAKNATDEELECFVHMWRLLGYLLGIRDEYNFCDGDLATVRLRSKQFVQHVVKPLITHVTKEWEHMARCAFQGIEKFTKLRINFECTVLYLCWILDIPTPNLFDSLSWKESAMFYVTKFVMTESHRIPGFAKFFNYRITKNIEKAQNDRLLCESAPKPAANCR